MLLKQERYMSLWFQGSRCISHSDAVHYTRREWGSGNRDVWADRTCINHGRVCVSCSNCFKRMQRS